MAVITDKTPLKSWIPIINSNTTTSKEASTTASSALSTANTAVSKADAAQSSADSAMAAATAAQSRADTAATAAERKATETVFGNVQVTNDYTSGGLAENSIASSPTAVNRLFDDVLAAANQAANSVGGSISNDVAANLSASISALNLRADDIEDSIEVLENPVATGSTTARTLQDRFADMANVKDFGAKGDGVTDDTDAINAALRSGKSVVFFPEGTYLVSHYLRVASNTKIIGDHAHLKGTGTEYYCFLADGDSNFSIEGFEFSYFRRCIDVRNCDNVVISNIYAHNMYRDETVFEDNYFATFFESSHIHVSQVRYENANANGDCIRVRHNCKHVTIRDIVGYCGDFFIVVVPDEADYASYIEDVIVDNVKTTANNYSGLQIETYRTESYIKNLTVTNCIFYSNGNGSPVQIANSTHGYYDSSRTNGRMNNIVFDNCQFIVCADNDGYRPAMRIQGVDIINLILKNCHTNFKASLGSHLGALEFGNALFENVQIVDCMFTSDVSDNSFSGIMLQSTAKLICWSVLDVIMRARTPDTSYVLEVMCTPNIIVANCAGYNCKGIVYLGAVAGRLTVTGCSLATRTVVSETGCSTHINGGGNLTYTDVLGPSGRVEDGMSASVIPSSPQKGDTFKPSNLSYMRTFNGENWQTIASTVQSSIRWAVFGDSLTAVNDTSLKFYHDYIKDKIECIVDNYAYSGSGYSVAGSGVPFYTRVDQIMVSPPPDVVTIFGSLNDLNSDGLPLGTATDADTSTICGCMNLTFDTLINRLSINGIVPVVGVISPTPWMSRGLGNTSAEAYCAALESICKAKGIPYLDLFHSSGLRPDIATCKTLMFDEEGIHPNTLGHKVIAARVEKFLLSLVS